MIGNVLFIGIVSTALLIKAALEAAYFKDGQAAKATLKYCAAAVGSVLCALMFSLLVDYIG